MLEIKDLHIRFYNMERDAVDGVNLSIEDGEIMGLVGESGSGKTVTAMSIAGLLPKKQCVCSGSILLDGEDMLNIERKQLRKILLYNVRGGERLDAYPGFTSLIV